MIGITMMMVVVMMMAVMMIVVVMACAFRGPPTGAISCWRSSL
jgi:hypothetical protein